MKTIKFTLHRFLFLTLAALPFSALANSEQPKPAEKAQAKNFSSIYSRLKKTSIRGSRASLESLLPAEEVACIKAKTEQALCAELAEKLIFPTAEERADKEKLASKLITLKAVEKIVGNSAIYEHFGKKPLEQDLQSARFELPEHVLADLKLFCGPTVSSFNYVLNLTLGDLDGIRTRAGFARASFELANVSTDSVAVKAKGAKIQWLIENPEKLAELDKLLQQIAENEGNWQQLFFDAVLHKQIYGLEPRPLGNFTAHLKTYFFTCIVLILIAGAISSNFMQDRELQILTYLCATVYGIILSPLQLIISYEAKAKQVILMKIRNMIEGFDQLIAMLPKEIFPEINTLDKFLEAKDCQETFKLFEQLSSKTFSGSPSIFSCHEKTATAYSWALFLREKFTQSFETIGLLDCYVSAARLVKKTQNAANGFCVAEVVESDTPILDCQGMWSPLVEAEKSVANDCQLGAGLNSTTGALVCGPERSGKQCYLEGAMTSVLFAQAFGIAPAKSLKFTPFQKFDCAFYDKNEEGKTSATDQALKIKKIIKSAKDAAKDSEKVFYIYKDPLVTGKDRLENQALLRASLKQLAVNYNGIFMLSINSKQLVENIVQDTRGALINLRTVTKVSPGSFSVAPTYRIEKGAYDFSAINFTITQEHMSELEDIYADAQAILQRKTN